MAVGFIAYGLTGALGIVRELDPSSYNSQVDKYIIQEVKGNWNSINKQ